MFLTASLSTTSLNFYKSIGTVANLSKSNLSALLSKLFKPFGPFFNSSISNSSTSDFKLVKSSFLANCHNFTNLIQFVLCLYYDYRVDNKSF